MIQNVISLILCFIGPILAAQFTIVDMSNVPHAFDMNNLVITFSGNTLSTNKGYSIPLSSVKEGVFNTVVSVSPGKKGANSFKATPSLSCVNSQIVLKASSTGYASIEVFNSLGRKVGLLYDGVLIKGKKMYFPLNVSPGTYYVHYKSLKKSETYLVRM